MRLRPVEDRRAVPPSRITSTGLSRGMYAVKGRMEIDVGYRVG